MPLSVVVEWVARSELRGPHVVDRSHPGMLVLAEWRLAGCLPKWTEQLGQTPPVQVTVRSPDCPQRSDRLRPRPA